MHPNHLAFISHVKQECRTHDMRLLLSKKQILRDGIHTYGGYFDEEKIAVSSGSDGWVIRTLAHEYSHLLQWIELDPAYFKTKLRGGIDSITIMNKWIEGHEYKKSTVNKALSLNRECELNCERRTINVIKQFNLHLDINKYCQAANSYILSYNFVKKVRTWDFKGSIYDKEIVDEMPTDLYSLDYSRLPRQYEALFRKVLM